MAKIREADYRRAAAAIQARQEEVTSPSLARELGLTTGEVRNALTSRKELGKSIGLQSQVLVARIATTYKDAAARIAERGDVVTCAALAKELNEKPRYMRNYFIKYPKKGEEIGLLSGSVATEAVWKVRIQRALLHFLKAKKQINAQSLAEHLGCERAVLARRLGPRSEYRALYIRAKEGSISVAEFCAEVFPPKQAGTPPTLTDVDPAHPEIQTVAE